LPHTDINEGMQQAIRLEQALLATPLGPGLDPSNVAFNVGIASIPDTCNHPGILIAAAVEALEQSKKTSSSILVVPSVEAPGSTYGGNAGKIRKHIVLPLLVCRVQKRRK